MIKDKILFICLGNICRSPMAETIISRSLISTFGRNQEHRL
ncbi:MAG: low molecular weight phosphotyrosine protein phosphatase, partial [Candidatus Aphodosoma sp.]